ncbi:MAG: class I SAM-dependent rRNA methyltransferase [Flavobacteriales bacterium]|nr:class I SAM-dependent rRNA methyltransferase [Flavobacteriales bacterium]
MKFPTVTLKPNKDQSLRRHHPWVFSGAIATTERFLQPGETVEVKDNGGNTLGIGHWSEGSIAVRMVSFVPFDDEMSFWREKLTRAWRLRESLGFISNDATNLFRLVNAEGDGMPGLIVDVYGTTAVIQVHSAGMLAKRQLFATLIAQVSGGRITSVFDKSESKIFSHTGQQIENGFLLGEGSDPVCRENGWLFEIDWALGQKTGFFIDQRENRALLGQYARGRKVLNTYCYTGGFSMYALGNGAAYVHSVDSSQRAIDTLEKNIQLNKFDTAQHRSEKADVQQFLQQHDLGYNLIVLDPPAFAKGLSARHSAVQAYRRLNATALKKIESGGLLFTFSCSQAVGRDLFEGAVLAAAIDTGRNVNILHRLHQPADHPISIYHPEGEYLKGLVISVD